MTVSDTLHDPRKVPRQARSRALVDAILDAAARILAERGRETLTTNAVAIRAGVSIGSLYQYFPNRDAIIGAVADRHAHRIYHQVADMDLSAETTLAAAIARIVGGLFAAHRIDPALHAALDGDLAHQPGHAHHRAHHHGGTKEAIAVQLDALSDAVRGEIRRPDRTLAAMTVAEIIHALAHAAIVHPQYLAQDPSTSDNFEREAIVAAVAYLVAPQ